MKKTNITIGFEQEKLKALRYYAGKKEASLQDELADHLQKLYEKFVPVQTREYIESGAEDEKPAIRQRPNRPADPGGSMNSNGGTVNERH